MTTVSYIKRCFRNYFTYCHKWRKLSKINMSKINLQYWTRDKNLKTRKIFVSWHYRYHNFLIFAGLAHDAILLWAYGVRKTLEYGYTLMMESKSPTRVLILCFRIGPWCCSLVGLRSQQNLGTRLCTKWWSESHQQYHQLNHPRSDWQNHHWRKWRQIERL